LNYTRGGIFDFRLPICDLQAATITARKSRHHPMSPISCLPSRQFDPCLRTMRLPRFADLVSLRHWQCKDSELGCRKCRRYE